MSGNMNAITSSWAQGILSQKTVIHEKEEAKEMSLAVTSAHDRMVPDSDAGRGNRKGFWEDSGFWVRHTETTKCRKIKAAGVLEFSTEYQWHGQVPIQLWRHTEEEATGPVDGTVPAAFTELCWSKKSEITGYWVQHARMSCLIQSG